MAEIINGVPIGDLPGIESVPDDSMLVVEFLGKAYHMPGAVLRQMIQDVLDSMGDSVDDVTEARLTAAIETVLASGKYNGFSPIVEVLDEEDGTSVLHVVDAFGIKKYPVEVKGARNAVQYVPQTLTDAQKAQVRENIGIEEIGNSILVELSGNPTDGYTALLSGEAVTGDELDEMAKNGSHITGVATESLVFQVSNGINGTSYTVPNGTIFSYGNAIVTGNPGFYGTGGVHSFEFRVCLQDYNFAIAYKAVANQDEKVWVSATQATHMVFRLGISQGIPAVLYGTQMLYGNSVPNMNYLYTILAESQLLNRPVFCYQVNMPFYTEDGTEMTPYSGVLFSLKINSAYQYFFEAEHEGYVYRFTVKQNEGYSCTAEPTEVYKKVQSKADDLKAEDGTLFLLSAGEPIGSGVPIPSGGTSEAVQYVEQTLTDEQKAQARSNIGAEAAGAAAALPAVKYEAQTLTDAQKAQARSNIGAPDDNIFIADYETTTYAEIKAAYDAGKTCFTSYGGSPVCQLVSITDAEALFICPMSANQCLLLVFTSDGQRYMTQSHDSAVRYNEQGLTNNQKAQARSNIGAAAAADIAATKYASTSTANTSYFKISDFGSWGTGAWYQKGFSMLITSRAGETVWFSLSANDSATTARAFRLMNTYSKIAGVYYSVSENAVYVKANAWCNNVTAHILSNIGGDYVPTVASVSGLASDAVEVDIIEFGPTSSGLAVGDSSTPLLLGGSATRPTYNGTDMALSSDLSSYLPLGGGLMTGPLKFQAASLPGKSLQYVCGVDAFGNGGEMGWQSKADFLSGYLTTTGTVAKATADANGNNIASTYANKNVGNTFNGEQKMINSTHCPTMNDIASGVGCSLKNARACDNQLIVAEIFAPTTTVTDSKINMSAVAGEIGFYHGGSGSGGQFSGKTQLARITSAGIYEGSTLLSNKYLAKSGGTMTGALNLKNSTWNLAGDDAYFGDNDTAGSFAIKGANGTTNLKMVTYNGTTSGTLSWNGSNFVFSNALNFPDGTVSGKLTVSGGAYISGRSQGGGDDEGIVIGRASNNYAGLTLGGATGLHTTFYLMPDNSAVWRYHNGSAAYDIKHPGKAGTIALTSDCAPLKVTLSGDATSGYSVDKTVSEIAAAWNAGRNVYLTDGVSIYNLSLLQGVAAASFTGIWATTLNGKSALTVETVFVASSGRTVMYSYSA